jgi:5,5'-dehydrodivanillate O-demethylase oxygenase subunit
MLRRYWWPIGFTEETTALGRPTAVRLLGEDLVLFRDGQERLGLVGLHCSHRGSSLEFGRVEESGIRCPYHGWLYDPAGRCLDQPAEPEDSAYKNQIRHLSYPVQEIGGLIFAYLGPEPAPLLPRYDLLVREDGKRVVGADEEHCNWLQRAENSVDQPHLPFLHASGYPHIAMKRPDVRWERTWYGVRITTNIPDAWTEKVSHSVFPSHSRITTARVNTAASHDLRLRVPTDDTQTTTFWINFYPHPEDQRDRPLELVTDGMERSVPGVYERVEDGWWGLPNHEQDRAAQESQGEIADRSAEHLASSDRGVLLLRQMIQESIATVAEGGDPIGVIRDPEQNRLISFDAKMQEIGVLVKHDDFLV